MTPLEKARRFMYQNARPLDLFRFRYHFESGSKEDVLQALTFYQNEDGGCGHAVEADCWNPNSTPLHANTAGDILREIDFEDASHPFVQGLLRYYTSGADFDGHIWNITVESNNHYPHAPWWHTESVSDCHTDYNGTAQIAGFLICYGEKNSPARELGLRVASEAIAALSPESLNDMHTCACYVHLLNWIRKGKAEHLLPINELEKKLHLSVHRLIEAGRGQWNGYCCKPIQFIRSRESEFYAENSQLSEELCDHILASQLPDGSFPVSWQWEDYPEQWHISKNWWRGAIIIENLLYLKGFDRL